MSEKKVTKNDLIDTIYINSSCDRNQVQKILDSFMNEIKKSLENGKTIELRGFGTFELRLRTRKEGTRNPKTGEVIESKPHYTAVFRAGQELEENLRKLTPEASDEK